MVGPIVHIPIDNMPLLNTSGGGTGLIVEDIKNIWTLGSDLGSVGSVVEVLLRHGMYSSACCLLVEALHSKNALQAADVSELLFAQDLVLRGHWGELLAWLDPLRTILTDSTVANVRSTHFIQCVYPFEILMCPYTLQITFLRP